MTAIAAPRADVRVPFAAAVLAMLPSVLDQTALATGLAVTPRAPGRRRGAGGGGD